MSADLLREAAALMRERAEAATDGVCPEWTRSAVRHIARNCDIECWHKDSDPLVKKYHDADGMPETWTRYDDAEHIASWHPAVALAVADWLESIATRHAPSDEPMELVPHYDDGPCEVCEDGGHECTVCVGCFPTWEGMDGYSTYPCAETKTAIAVARAFLGRADA